MVFGEGGSMTKPNPKLRDVNGVPQVSIAPRNYGAQEKAAFSPPDRITNSMGANGYCPKMPECTRPGAGQLSPNGRAA
jgi:hypothetical protein